MFFLGIYVLGEVFISGYNTVFLDILFFVSVINAIAVIVCKNPVISVLYLIGLFFSIACYLIILGINYIGLAYLLVYVGAVSILFLFVLMLINIRISELTSNNNKSMPLLFITTVAFFIATIKLIPFTFILYNNINIFNFLFSYFNSGNIYNDLTTDIGSNFTSDDFDIFFATSKSWDSHLWDIGHINSIGNIMYSSYSMWLIITSIILLLAMVGAIVITIK